MCCLWVKKGMSAFVLLRIEPETCTWCTSSLPLSYTPTTVIFLILKQSASDQVRRTSVYTVYLVQGSPAKGKSPAYLCPLFGCLTSSYSLIEGFPSGTGISNLVSVVRSHAKKWWAAVPGPPLTKAIPPKPSPATGIGMC